MPTANAALISDHPWDLSAHGIDCLAWAEAHRFLTQANPSILAVHVQAGQIEETMKLLASERQRHSKKHFIIIHDDLNAEDICKLHNQVHLTQIHAFSEDLPVHTFFAQCFDKYFKQEQSEKLTELIQ